jgi:hypothetical protein
MDAARELIVQLRSSQGGFFQPYLPLQEIDMLRADSWLVGTTNSIVTQQKDCQWDLLINVSVVFIRVQQLSDMLRLISVHRRLSRRRSNFVTPS